jgi:hypothetical protein
MILFLYKDEILVKQTGNEQLRKIMAWMQNKVIITQF